MAIPPTSYIPDCLFPSVNELEVPTLRLDVQPTCAAIPFVCFGEQKRTFKMHGTGTLHFYTAITASTRFTTTPKTKVDQMNALADALGMGGNKRKRRR